MSVVLLPTEEQDLWVFPAQIVREGRSLRQGQGDVFDLRNGVDTCAFVDDDAVRADLVGRHEHDHGDCLLVPTCSRLCWRGNGLGIGRDARSAYSGLLGRYMARAHLTEHEGVHVLVPLDEANLIAGHDRRGVAQASTAQSPSKQKNAEATAFLLLLTLASSGWTDEPTTWRTRLGISTGSGAVALEAERGPTAYSVGWLPRLETDNDTGIRLNSGIRLVLTLRTFLQPKSPNPFFHNPFVGICFISNNKGYAHEILSEPAPDLVDLENFETYWIERKSLHTIGGFVGYRYLFNDRYDATLGGGLGLNLIHDEDAEYSGIKKVEPLIDLTIGLVF